MKILNYSLFFKGIVRGSKIFIDFTKFEFSESIRRLLIEIKHCVEEDNRRSSSIITEPVVRIEPKETNHCIDWTEIDVSKWLREKEIHQIIVENVYPCNGRVLYQLYKMQCEAPEFFYKSISSKYGIPTRCIAHFAIELKDIFQ